MELLKKIMSWLDNRRNFIVILNILALCLVGYMIYETSTLWRNLINLFILFIKPFFVAFVISYVFEPFVHAMTKRKIPRPIAIAILVTFLILTLSVFIGTLIPLLYTKITELIVPLSNGMQEVQLLMMEHFHLDISSMVSDVIASIQQWVMNFSFMNTALGIITNILGKVGSYIIYLILSIYFLADWQHIRQTIKNVSNRLNADITYCLKEIDVQLRAYIQAFIILMIIQTCVYGTIYLLIGHSNWLLLGLLSGLACIFPYIGPMSVNVLGFLTALDLDTIRIVLLIVAIFIQSNVDSYVITPKVYSSRIQIEPVYVIFGLLSASTLLGPWGIVAAMPILVIIKISIKSIRELKAQKAMTQKS